MMKRYFGGLFGLLLVMAVIGCGGADRPAGTHREHIEKVNIKTGPVAAHYSIRQFMDIDTIRGIGFSPHEDRVFFSSDRTGVSNIYSVSLNQWGRGRIGGPVALTHSTTVSYEFQSAFPDDDRLLLSADSGGNEVDHLFLRDETGDVRDLTPEIPGAPGANARSVFLDWARDLNSFFFTSNKRDPRYRDLYKMDARSLSPALFFTNTGGFYQFKVSGDQRYIALHKIITRDHSDVWLHDRQTSQTKNITSPGNDTNQHDEKHGESELKPVELKPDVRNIPLVFGPRGKTLYFLTDRHHQFLYLCGYDLESGRVETVLKRDWDIKDVYFSHGGTYRVVIGNRDGRDEVEIVNTRTGQPVVPSCLTGGHVGAVRISRSESLMAFLAGDSASPPGLYVYDFRTGACKQIVRSMGAAVDPGHLVRARGIRYKSFDGLEIPAFFYKPRVAVGQRNPKTPALVWVHGGPGGQSRPRYNALIQYLVNHGYAVLAVNNRGSSGYGKSFYRKDDLHHGDGDLRDCVAAKAFLIADGGADPEKIGIIGTSYGGYMVLAALTFKPREFAVGVDLFGVSNWLRTLKSIPAWWESRRQSYYRELGDPEKQPDYLRKISPLFHAQHIVRPLIVLQGANDPRVLRVESDEIVAAVRKNGVPVQYLVFEDEGHGFSRKQNKIKAYRAVLEFLDTHLKGKKEDKEDKKDKEDK